MFNYGQDFYESSPPLQTKQSYSQKKLKIIFVLDSSSIGIFPEIWRDITKFWVTY